MDQRYKFFNYFIIIAVLIAGVAGLWAMMLVSNSYGQPGQSPLVFISGSGGDVSGPGGDGSIIQTITQASGVKGFASAAEFKEYLEESEGWYGAGAGFGFAMNTRAAMPMVMPTMAIDTMAFSESSGDAFGVGFLSGSSAEKQQVDRFSTTNVQVQGIDEPDILKTDGKEIYFSSPSFFIEPFRAMDDRMAIPEIGIMPPRRYGGVKAINAFPPADIKVDATIETQGDLLLYEDTLMVFSGNTITGYDVSDPSDPEDEWDIKLEDRSWIVDSRLKGDTLYLITRTNVQRDRPCPIRPLDTSFGEIVIPCTRIYHPISPIPVDSTYTIHEVDVASGEVESSTSFVGSSSNSVVYMSADALYITYQQPGDIIAYAIGFFTENTDLVPNWLVERLDALARIDISQEAKSTEFSVLMSRWQETMDDDDRLRLENELEDRMSDYQAAHARELDRTGIVKITLDDLKVTASGSVPGSPLNQFALDEYQGNLRVATTIGANRNFFSFGFGISESVSDVTILDSALRELGSVQDMGRTERIFSVRFIQDKGYVVTFRQVDPFYVLDLSNPNRPKLRGELKIPGFSSYLHPISEDEILGVGREGSKVKLSLFDVSDPSDPQEGDKYMLDEHWSEIQNTHHAFLMDDKHEIFFIPGSRGGYIFSYQDGDLRLEKAVSNIRARRALFINDYLYVVGDDKMVVLNENDWTRVNEIDYN